MICLRLGNRNLKHKGTVALETERFSLRPFKITDVHDAYVNWFNDMDSARYNAWSVHENESVTRSYISEIVHYYGRTDYYHWAITDKISGETIGSVSVSNIKNRKKYCEIGYTVAKKRWNQGIATEALKKVLEFMTFEVGFETVRAMHDIRNKASGRVMEKAGMVFLKNQMQVFLSGNNIIMNCCVYEYKNIKNIQ
ncbi:MAG TPA: N-acetyltransferase [Clostridiales bacterium]|nr:N-acetyltransferase [Clostridiales bacterium]